MATAVNFTIERCSLSELSLPNLWGNDRAEAAKVEFVGEPTEAEYHPILAVNDCLFFPRGGFGVIFADGQIYYADAFSLCDLARKHMNGETKPLG